LAGLELTILFLIAKLKIALISFIIPLTVFGASFSLFNFCISSISLVVISSIILSPRYGFIWFSYFLRSSLAVLFVDLS